MFSAPQLLVWSALACCMAPACLGAPAGSELDTAETRAQGWFRGIGLGHFSFGDGAETSSDEKVDTSKDEDQTFQIYKFGLSELQKKQLELAEAQKEGQMSEENIKDQNEEASKMQTESQGGQEGANKDQEKKGEDVKDEVADYYFGRRGQQQSAFSGHSRTKNLAKEYAIVEETDESAMGTEDNNDEKKEEEMKQTEEEQSSGAEETDSSEVLKDFYSGFKGKSGHTHGGHKHYAAYSAVRQTSYFPSSKVNKEQVSDSGDDKGSGSKFQDGYSFHLVLPVKH